MARKFPILKRSGSVVVKVYRVKHKTAAGGHAYTMAWIDPGEGRRTRQFGDVTKAEEEAQTKADQLAQGLSETEHASRSDLQELGEARRLAGTTGVLPALREWQALRDAATAKLPEKRKRIGLRQAVTDFIAGKVAAGKQAKTYSAKLGSLVAFVGDVPVHTITAATLTAWLNSIADAVTRNDLRKRAVALFRWLRKMGYLPRGVETEIEHTERAKEKPTTIGILTPAQFREVLELFRKEYPQHLAAIVVAGFCGVRADEIHGKLEDGREKRQTWEDIDLKAKHLHVTNAKTNTPAHRLVPICPAAVEWLRLCPGEHKGPIAVKNALGLVRLIMRRKGQSLPENCFRHSFVTYDIALREDKPSTATRAGNSVKEIDQRYRVPKPKTEGRAWFDSTPHGA